MMRADVEGSDEVSCYGDFVYRSSGDTTHSNQVCISTLYSTVVQFIGRDTVLCIMKSGTGVANECVPSFINEHRLCLSSITGFSPPRARYSPKLGHAETGV